jgi:hypothetical protein
MDGQSPALSPPPPLTEASCSMESARS